MEDLDTRYIENYDFSTINLEPEITQKILYDFNNTKTFYQNDKTINELFEQQVEVNPETMAIVFGDKYLTYRELDQKADALSAKLIENGVKPETIVGIMVLPSLEMVISIIAVLKAGGAYLPLDPTYPLDRIDYMIRDSKTSIVITNVKQINDFIAVKVIDLNDASLFKDTTSRPTRVNNSNNLAYVLYTSGSTGRPKGVMIEHKAVINFIKGMVDRIEFPDNCVMLAVTTISFDISVMEILLPLLSGYKVVIANEKQRSNPGLLCKLVLKNNINTIQLTPSRLQLLLTSTDLKKPMSKLKVLMVGGEVLHISLLERVRTITSARIYNLYGPTETTIWSTLCDLSNSNDVNIGRPISNTQVYIVNACNQLLPIGDEGEICIAGEGLSRGYLNREELTKEKFISIPFLTHRKMYKTGDIGKWLPDGCIEFLGRKDDQVKIRGYRIELGEIESAILRNDSVELAAVVEKEDQKSNRCLYAFVVLKRKITEAELRLFLSKRLPEYMLPSYFIFLDTMPFTPNGKVNKKALREMDNSNKDFNSLSMQVNDKSSGIDEVEFKVRSIISLNSNQSCSVNEIQIDDNLKIWGVDSINFVKILVALEKEFKFTFDDDHLNLESLSTVNEIVSYIKANIS